MKSHISCFGLVLILKFASCGSFTWLDQMDQLRSSVLQPLAELSSQLDTNIAEYEAGKAELEARKSAMTNFLATAPEHCRTESLVAHAQLAGDWQLDGCLNLTGDWSDGVLLGMRVAIYSANISQSLFDTINNIASLCAKKSFMKIASCYYDNSKTLVNDILDLHKKLTPYVTDAKGILKRMSDDLKSCLGIQHSIHDKIERHLKSCKNGQFDQDT